MFNQLHVIAILVFLIFANPTNAGFLLKIDNSKQEYIQDSTEKIEAFLNEVENLLPDTIKESIARTILIKFDWLNKNVKPLKIVLPKCTPQDSDNKKVTLGMVIQKAPIKHLISRISGKKQNIRQITLDRSILGTILDGKKNALLQKYPCGHGNSWNLALSCLIHELAHIYDFEVKRLNQELENEKNCRTIYKKYTRLKNINRTKIKRRNRSYSNAIEFKKAKKKYMGCSSYIHQKRSVSLSPYFLNLTGWVLKGRLYKRRVVLNHAWSRNPDTYEYKNPAETFAVNMEFFLLDPEYKNRRPTYYRYFSELFEIKPFENRNIKLNTELPISTGLLSSKSLKELDLNSKRLYEIDYLLAGKGDEMMSRWGHSMFRLVFCKPGRPLGPDCRFDLAHHVVVNYRAEISDLNIKYIKGLTGGYDSKVYLLTMSEIVDEYTKGQFRELKSAPLKLTIKQKEIFIERLLEQYWAYNGKYYFLSNNCASESLNLLRVIYNSPSFQVKSILSPLGIFDFLKKRNLIDMSVFDDMKLATDRKYYYPPFYLSLQKSIDIIRNENSDFKWNDAKKYTLLADASERLALMEQTISQIENKNKKKRKRILSNFIQLEEYILLRLSLKLTTEITDYIAEQLKKKNANSQNISKPMKKFKKSHQETLPENTASSGYGIPFANEVKSVSPEKMKQLSDDLKDFFDSIQKVAYDKFKKIVTKIETTGANYKFFHDEYRVLRNLKLTNLGPVSK